MSAYHQLLEGGFAPDDINKYIRTRFRAGGYSDQEIGGYINANAASLFKYGEQDVTPPSAETPETVYREFMRGFAPAEGQSPTPEAQDAGEAGGGDFFQHGLQGSVSGLAMRKQLPDAVSPEALENADWLDRLALGAGQMIGDVPALVAGGLMGVAGGPAAPVTIPAAAMALAEGFRASYMDRIANGHMEDFFYIGGLQESLAATAKGGVIGGATGGAGVLAKTGAAALGASVPVASAAGIAAEIATMPTVAATLEGRVPHPQEFVDAAMFVGLMRGVNGIRHIRTIVPKLRDIYVKTGKIPQEVARAAEADQTVLQDILATNKDIPDAFIRDIERETIYNDSRSVKVEAVKTGESFSLEDRPQLRAYLESLNPEEIKALKYADPDQYLAVLKDMVSELFPEGADLRFRTENGVYDYEHLLKDTTRQDYIVTLPKTLKDSDIRVEFTTLDGAEKAYLIKKFFDPDIQKDIWDLIVIQDGMLITKIARKDRKGIDTVDSTIRRAEREASQLATAAGDLENASTRTTLPVEQNSKAYPEVKPDTLQSSGGGTTIPIDPNKPALPDTALNHADVIPLSGVAEVDQTVLQDILSENVTVPGAFAEATLNRLKAGEKVSTEELQGYLPRPWAKAELLERQGLEAVRKSIKDVVENTLRDNRRNVCIGKF
jgi:hypothetical protein